jgi:hypothetical protein
MASVSIVKIKIRRGTEAERRQIVLDSGELGYTVDADSRRLFIGDGVTTGGNPASIKVYPNATLSDYTTINKAQNGDIIYDRNTKQLSVITGLDNSYTYSAATYNYIGPGVDNTSIGFSSLYPGASGILTVKASGIDETKIKSSAFLFSSTTGGVFGGGGNKIAIYHDNKLRISNFQLTTNEASFDMSLLVGTALPTTAPAAGTRRLWIDTAAGNVIKVAV